MPNAVQACTAPAETPGCELADIFLRYGEAYEQTHRLTAAQRKVAWAIIRCRTAALGGHREWCAACGFERYAYHSCRNRHCPKCQTTATAAWVAARRQELLPVPYFHNVFTLPHELNGLILYSQRNQRALLKLLFDAAAQTLLEFGRQELSGKVGFTLVLHTWDQQLRAHFHVHGLIASGALADNGSFAGPRKLLDYLARYTHRVAISNHRLLDCQGGQVRYHYRDRRDGDRLKTDVLSAEEFLRRFLQHVLPDHFPRIRHYGLLANCVKGQQLAQCRQLLGTRPPTGDDQPHSAADWMRVLLDIDITRCPCCGATLYRQELQPSVPSLAEPCLPLRAGNFRLWDTS